MDPSSKPGVHVHDADAVDDHVNEDVKVDVNRLLHGSTAFIPKGKTKTLKEGSVRDLLDLAAKARAANAKKRTSKDDERADAAKRARPVASHVKKATLETIWKTDGCWVRVEMPFADAERIFR